MSARVTIIGKGAFGTAMARALRRNGLAVTLLGREWRAELDSVDDAPVLLGVPAQAHRALFEQLGERSAGALFTLAKGIERDTGKLLPEVAAEFGFDLGLISGPSFAADLEEGKPTALTIAGGQAETFAAKFTGKHLRFYASDDVTGVALLGAMKNVIAIACGAANGLGLGPSAQAALMTRGLAEIGRLNLALGGRVETLSGLAGVGDLALTCNSEKSRNFRFGQALALGLEQNSDGVLVEGAATAYAAQTRARSLGVDLPITDAVIEVIDGENLETVVTKLMAR